MIQRPPGISPSRSSRCRTPHFDGRLQIAAHSLAVGLVPMYMGFRLDVKGPVVVNFHGRAGSLSFGAVTGQTTIATPNRCRASPPRVSAAKSGANDLGAKSCVMVSCASMDATTTPTTGNSRSRVRCSRRGPPGENEEVEIERGHGTGENERGRCRPCRRGARKGA